MPAIARLADPISCGDNVGQGSNNVFCNFLPIARATQDMTAGHCYPPTLITSGSSTVFVNNKPIAMVGSPIEVHCCGIPCHGGSVAVGSSDVNVGS